MSETGRLSGERGLSGGRSVEKVYIQVRHKDDHQICHAHMPG